ncbi:2,5-didehydrogluconate reductase B, partial [Acinetobacter pittii]|nr:2,5-didehydrogluconate reductase B [Acinetobacter pittii]
MHLKLNNYLISDEYMTIPRFGLVTFRLKDPAV